MDRTRNSYAKGSNTDSEEKETFIRPHFWMLAPILFSEYVS